MAENLIALIEKGDALAAAVEAFRTNRDVLVVDLNRIEAAEDAARVWRAAREGR